MNKFYVYAVKTDKTKERTCVYVDEQVIEQFALHQFEPHHMEFSGVMVEADSPQEAHEVYNTFGMNEIVWTDEPACTFKKRQAFNGKNQLMNSKLNSLADALGKAEQAATQLAIHAYAKGISMDLIQLNDRLSRMADLVRQSSNNSPEVTSQELYERLKKRYIEKLGEHKYSGPGPSGQTAG
jgi:hypothetical protein